jgi:hypothetical protein
MEAVSTFKTLVNSCETTQHNTPKYSYIDTVFLLTEVISKAFDLTVVISRRIQLIAVGS